MNKKLTAVLAFVCVPLIAACGQNKTTQTEAVVKDSIFESDMAPAVMEYDDDMIINPSVNAVAGSADFLSASDSFSGSNTTYVSPKTSPESAVSDELTDISAQTEKMVYYGNITVDTLDFDKSIDDFKKKIEEAGGFISEESYSDGAYVYNYFYQVDEDEKNNVYEAQARVPAGKYKSVMDTMSDLGDVRSLTSESDNETENYSDLSIRLDILEKSYDRYMELLKEAEDESTLLMLQEKLFETELEIERVRSSMQRIDNDVAYSYIYLTIRAVEEYEAPANAQTFGYKIGQAFKSGLQSFANFFQGLFLFLLRALPFILLIGFVILAVTAVIGKIKTKRAQKAEALRVLENQNALYKRKRPSYHRNENTYKEEFKHDASVIPAEKLEQNAEKQPASEPGENKPVEETGKPSEEETSEK